MRRRVVVLALMCALMGVTEGVGRTADKKVIHVACPRSMFDRMHAVSKMFMKDHPLTQVDFMENVNVNGTFQALLDKSVDVALTTRTITAAEAQLAKDKGLELTERIIGHGGIVIITNPRNPLNELTVEQVKKIFTGKYSNWKQVGGTDEPITVVRVGELTYPGTVFFMQEDFFGGIPFASNAAVVSEFAGVLRQVTEIRGAAGFVRIRDAFELALPYSMAIKVLKIKADAGAPAIEPSRTTIEDASYPIRRPYYVYYANKADRDVIRYVEFVQEKGWGSQNL